MMTRMAGVVEAKIGTCWWCGNTADSREHRFKRTDIEREFGRGPYLGHLPAELLIRSAQVRILPGGAAY
jgi:hypothetical protein